MVVKRLITHRQEQIFRMRHHDFGGLTTKQVAIMLGITTTTVARHMREMQIIAPQLFPILTQRQALIYRLYVEMGLSLDDIGTALGITKSCVGVVLYRLRKKGLVPARETSRWFFKFDKPKSYDSLYDNRIKLKF